MQEHRIERTQHCSRPGRIEDTIMKIKDEASERIKRLRKTYLDDMVWISIERAQYYTEGWK